MNECDGGYYLFARLCAREKVERAYVDLDVREQTKRKLQI